MSRKANKTAIGAFVIGAAALLLTGILVFGSGAILKKSDKYVIFFDEPSAGLDPVSARMLDDLILQLRDTLGATLVVVTHELASIFAVVNNSVFLDAESKTMIAAGNPKELLANSSDPRVIQFLTRGARQGARI